MMTDAQSKSGRTPGRGLLNKGYVAALLFTLPLLLPFTAAHGARRPTVRSIAFSGNITYTDDELIARMELRPPFLIWRTEFDDRVLQRDIGMIRAYYREHGFLQAATSDRIDSSNGRVDILITVEEGPRTIIDNVTVSPNPVVTDSLAFRLGVRPGRPLIYPIIDSVVRAFGDSLGARGFLSGRITLDVVIDTVGHTADIVFLVLAGPRVIVDTITLRGIRGIDPEVIRRQLTFRSGDTLTTPRVRSSKRRLYTTRLFNFVNIEPRLEDTLPVQAARDTIVPVTVTIDEAAYFTLDAGVGYGSYQRLYGSLLVSYGNLFGRGHTIAMNDSVSVISQRAELVYSTPWLFLIPVRVNASVFYRRHGTWLYDVPIAYTGLFNGFSLGLGQTLRGGWSYQGRLEWENVIRLQVAPGVELPEDVLLRTTASLIGNILLDRRDDVFDPTRGYYSALRVQLAGLTGAGTNQFVRTELSVAGYWTAARRLLLGSGAMIGWATPYGAATGVPPQDLFYAGGPQSVRGFPFERLRTTEMGDPLGGTVLLVAHLIDFQFPIFRWLQGALFADAGYVWTEEESINPRDLRPTAGPGLRLATPIGLFRLDAGFQLDRLGEPDGYAIGLGYGRPF